MNSENRRSGIETILEREDHWVTDMGAFFPGERVVLRGKDLFNDLGNKRWMQLLLFGITGREFNDNQCTLFESIWVISASYPDPRLWNNRVAGLAGTCRSTGNLGISAAIAVSEASIYGQVPLIKSIDLLKRALSSVEQGVLLKDFITGELKNRRWLPGFGRPIISNDERIQPLYDIANKLGFAEGKYTQLVFEIEKELQSGRWRLSMNVAALDAALAADQGLSPNEFYTFMILCFTAGMIPCYQDAVSKHEGTLFPLRCDRVSYEGKEQRNWITLS